jgi:acetolactate synthase-1/2/3 large subunit
VVLALGTALSEVNRPSPAALGGKPFASLHRVPSFIGNAPGHAAPMLDVQAADLRSALDHLLAAMPTLRPGARHGWPMPGPCRSLALARPAQPGMVPMRAAVEALDEAHADADVVVDAGNAGAAAVHYLRPRGRALFSVALGMGAMGHSFGCAIGAAFASRPRKRSLVIAGDGAYFMHGMEIHTAWQHGLPITFALFNNNGHAMCHLRERLYLGQPSGEHLFKSSRLAEGLAAMLPGLPAHEVDNVADLNAALAKVAQLPGPAVIALQISADEMPPFLPFLVVRARTAAPSTPTGPQTLTGSPA